MISKFSHIDRCHSVALCLAVLVLVASVNSSGIYRNAYRKMSEHRVASTLESIPLEQKKDLKNLDELFAKCNGIDIRELTILEVQSLFATKRLTSFALTNCYLDRIQHMNPVLRAVIQVNPDAIRQAIQADSELDGYAGRGERLMLGIPMLLKDNVGTKDFMETTAGTLALLGIKPVKDADIVTALRKAGAVILGKANLSEFAYFRGTDEPSGWSGRGGQTRNAYNLGADPSGSSSGSAVAVAANLALVSIGTETDGSLIAPSSVGAICTIKPTLGSPSTKGVIPISHSQDNVGPMARTIMDTAILLDTISTSENDTQKCGGSYLKCLLKKRKHETFRIGVMRYPFWDITIVNSTDLAYEIPYLENIVAILKGSSRFHITDPAEYRHDLYRQVKGSNEIIVLLHDFKHDINEYLKRDVTSLTIPRKMNSLKDIIEFNKKNPPPEGYNQELLIRAEATDGLQNRTYLEVKRRNIVAARAILDTVLIENNLDAVITPSEPRSDTFPEFHDSASSGYSIAAIAGYPSVNIPAGIGINGVPFGLTFIGRPHTEARLLQIAHEVEQMAPRRQRPLFLF